MGIWGMPQAVIEAVAHHHTPDRASVESFDVDGVGHVADALVREVHYTDAGVVGARAALDSEYVELLGLGEKVAVWRDGIRESGLSYPAA